MQLENTSSLIVQPLAGGPSAPTQYLSNRSFCMLLQLAALSGFAAYVAKCSRQLSESEQMCHSSSDHPLFIQPNGKYNVVGQRPSSEGDGAMHRSAKLFGKKVVYRRNCAEQWQASTLH